MTNMLITAWVVVAVYTSQVQKTHMVVDNTGLSDDDIRHLVCHMKTVPSGDGFFEIEESSSNLMAYANGITSMLQRTVFQSREREVSIVQRIVEDATTSSWYDISAPKMVDTAITNIWAIPGISDMLCPPTNDDRPVLKYMDMPMAHTNRLYYNAWRSGSECHLQ